MSKKIMLRMAKPNEADREMLMDLTLAFNDISDGLMPNAVSDDDGDEPESLEMDSIDDRSEAFYEIMRIVERGSLDRCVWTLLILMDPANRVVNPEASHVELHPHIQRAFGIVQRLAGRCISTGSAYDVERDAAELWREMQTAESAAIKKGGE